MALTIRNLVGEYGVSGLGTLKPGETRECSPETAAWALTRQGELEVGYSRDDGDPETVGFYGPVDASFGYGGASILILRALTQLGRRAFVHPFSHGGPGSPWHIPSRQDLHPDAAAHLGNRAPFPQWSIAHCLPDSLPFLRSPRTVAYTMWETTLVPDGSNQRVPFGNWVDLINRHADHLAVPCKHNAEVFAACGVERPISVLPYGLDTDAWPLMERPEREEFLFVQYGDLTERKGPRETAAAFQRAFPTERDVRLVLKTQFGHLGYVTNGQMPVLNDDRIVIVDETWPRAKLLQLLQDANAFVWPSRGEGFGLPPLQAALTGLPVITTTHTGMAEYFDAKYFYGVRTAGTSPAPLYGEWYEPDVDHLAEQMRKVYENRAAAARKGKQAAGYVRKHFSLAAYAERLGAFLSTLGAAASADLQL